MSQNVPKVSVRHTALFSQYAYNPAPKTVPLFATHFALSAFTNLPNICIIISVLQIVQSNLIVEIVRSIAEGVDICDVRRNFREGLAVSVCYRTHLAPRIVGVSCNSFGILINDGNYVALQVLEEVVGNIIVDNTADRILVVVQRRQNVSVDLVNIIVIPTFAQDLRSVKGIFVLNSVYGFRGANTVCIVGVVNDSSIRLNELLKLSALLPGQRMTQVVDRVALYSIISSLPEKVNKNSAPQNEVRRKLYKGWKNILCVLIVLVPCVIIVDNPVFHSSF